MPRPMRYGAKAKRMQAFVSPETFSALTDRAARSNCSVGEVIDALVQDANGEGGPVSRRGVLRAALREGEAPPTPLDPDRPLEGMTLRMEPPPQFFTPEQVREQAQRLIRDPGKGGYPSGGVEAKDLVPPPAGPAPGAKKRGNTDDKAWPPSTKDVVEPLPAARGLAHRFVSHSVFGKVCDRCRQPIKMATEFCPGAPS